MPHTKIDTSGRAPEQAEIQNALREIVQEHGVGILGCSDSGQDVFAAVEQDGDGVRVDIDRRDTTTQYRTDHLASKAIGLNAEADDDVAQAPDDPGPGEMSRDEVINNVLARHFEDSAEAFARDLHDQLTNPATNPRAPFADAEDDYTPGMSM